MIASDVRDPYAMRQVVAGCDVVMNLAALIAIPYSYHAPESYLDTNVTGAINLFQACRDLGVKRIVQTSTSEVYGTAQYVPIDEAHPLQAQSPYAASKIAADQMALAFHRSFNLPVSVIRPFNTYGPRQSARAVIPTIITQIASGKRQIKLGSLHPTRDFNYVTDTAAGFMAVAESEQTVGEVVNIGSNHEIRIGDLVQLIADLMQVEIEIITSDDRLRPQNSEVERLWADNRKAMKLLDWQPAYAGVDGLKKGLQETIQWFCLPENLAKYRTDQFVL